jgi:putative ABC transport system ATP-binding protein
MPDNARAMLSLKQVSKSHPGATRPVLHGLNLQLEAGDYVAIVGESGSGKSTLLNLIAGLELPDQGEVHLDGRNLAALDDDARTLLRRRELGFVFQAFLLLPYLTALDNAALTLKLNGVRHREAQREAQALLAAVGLGEAIHRFPSSLSGGEAQRVAVARALAHRPKLLLADEPTGNLDADSARLVLDTLRAQIKSRAATGILVTHSVVAAASADRIYELRDGMLHPA